MEMNSAINNVKKNIAPLPILAKLYIITLVMPFGLSLGPIYATPQRLLLLLLILPMMTAVLSGRYGKVIFTDFLFTLFTLWSIIATAQVSPEMLVGSSGTIIAEFLGGYFAGRLAIRDAQSFNRMCLWLAVITALTVPLAMMESITDTPYLIYAASKIPGLSAFPDVNYEPRMGLFRAQVFLSHPIHYGLFCSTVISTSILCLRDVVSRRTQYFLISCAVAGVCLSLSSGALLPMFLQIGLILWAWMLRNVKNRWWIFIGLFAAGWIFIDVASSRSPLVVFLSYLTFSSHNAYFRILIFDWGMVNVWGSPFFGIGFNDWIRPEFMHSASVDNFWLIIAMRYGIPAFVLIALGYTVGLLRVVFKKISVNSSIYRIRLAWVLTFVSLTLTLSTVHIWTTMYSYTFFLFGAGMWMIHAKNVEDKEAEIDASVSDDRRKNVYTRFAPVKRMR